MSTEAQQANDYIKRREELKMDIGDFEFEEKIGDGSFSEVFKGALKKRMSAHHPLHKYGKYFACKLVNKRAITINRQSSQFIGAIMRERKALYECQDIPFVLQLYATAKNDKHIAFITELCANGDLLQFLKKNGSFSIDSIRYYASCIIVALDALHEQCIIHRDVKPENIMLNNLNQPILSDFGCVRLIRPKFEKRESIKSDPDFVGTPQFMAPELISIPKSVLMQSPEEILYGNAQDENENKDDDDEEEKESEKETAAYRNDTDGRLRDEYYKCLDLWSFGCTLYQLRTSKLLFDGVTEFLVFKEVKTMNFTLRAIKDEIFKDLLSKLLEEKPMERIGADNMNNLKKHLFFKGIEWDKLTTMKAPGLDENNSN